MVDIIYTLIMCLYWGLNENGEPFSKVKTEKQLRREG